MRTFLNHIKNETLDEIETSLENLWQQMIQLSEFFQYSFVLILKRKCLVRASRVRSGESGTPSTIIYTLWSSRRYELGCDTPVVLPNTLNKSVSIGSGHLGLWPSWRVVVLTESEIVGFRKLQNFQSFSYCNQNTRVYFKIKFYMSIKWMKYLNI